MLLANRRLALVYGCLAGMEVAWFTPALLLIFWWSLAWQPLAVYAGLLAVLLGWMLALELLSRRHLTSPRFELTVLGLIVLSSALLVRVFVYGGRPWSDLGWLATSFAALSDFRNGLHPEWGLILVNLFLWQRAASASSREVSFFSVGMSFRLGMLLLILSAAVFGHFTGQDATPFLWLYFALGLTAVGLTRIHESSLAARSAGAPLAPWRLLQLLAMVGATVGLAALLSRAYTIANLRTVLSWFSPLGRWLGILFYLFVQAVFWLLMPFLSWLQRHMSGVDLSPLGEALHNLSQALATQEQTARSAGAPLPPWVLIALRDLGIVLGLVLALGLIWLYLERTRGQRLAAEREQEGAEQVTLGRETLRRGLQRLRDLGWLVRRFGLGRQLLAAISVQNMYANLCRLARQRGYARRPAQPPDDYLPTLAQAFAGQHETLGRLTAAYMRVHYGDRPVGHEELRALREDYERARRAEPPG